MSSDIRKSFIKSEKRHGIKVLFHFITIFKDSYAFQRHFVLRYIGWHFFLVPAASHFYFVPAIFQDASFHCVAVSKMGLIASRGIELEDSYRSFSEKERQILSSLFEKLATTNEHGVMKVEIGPLRVSSFYGRRPLQAAWRGQRSVWELRKRRSIFFFRILEFNVGEV